MERNILSYIRKHNMVNEGDKVLVGLSGGADSMCLLLVLIKLKALLKMELCAVHVNHGLRGKDSDNDQSYVEKICNELGVTCCVKAADVKGMVKEHKLSEEEAARILRYRIFEETAKENSCNKIAVAHHGDDQAETVLFQLFRGSGLKGISGMMPVRDSIIRPLLCVDRCRIEEYLIENNVKYCTDKTNFSTDYTRNKIRLQVLPLIKENINEGIVAHLNNLAEDAMKADAYFCDKAMEIFKKNSCCQEGVLKLPCQSLKDDIISSYVIRICISSINKSLKDISRKHIESVLQMSLTKGNKEVILPYGIKVTKEYDKLLFMSGNNLIRKKNAKEDMEDYLTPQEITIEKKKIMEAESGIVINYNGKTFRLTVKQCENNINFQKNVCTKSFDYDKIKDVFSFRTRRSGDFLVINKSGGTKKLKDYFIDEKIPKSERDENVLVADDSHIMWIVGHRISEQYKITEETRYILEIEMSGG